MGFNVKFINYLHHMYWRSPGRGDGFGHLQIVNVAHVVIGNDCLLYLHWTQTFEPVPEWQVEVIYRPSLQCCSPSISIILAPWSTCHGYLWLAMHGWECFMIWTYTCTLVIFTLRNLHRGEKWWVFWHYTFYSVISMQLSVHKPYCVQVWYGFTPILRCMVKQRYG